MANIESEAEGKNGLQLERAVEQDLAADWSVQRGKRPTMQKRAEAGLQTASPGPMTSIYFIRGRWYLAPAGLESTWQSLV